MNTKISAIFLLLLLPLAILITGCPLAPPQMPAGRAAFAGFADRKEYSAPTLEDKFAEDRVVVVLNKASSYYGGVEVAKLDESGVDVSRGALHSSRNLI